MDLLDLLEIMKAAGITRPGQPLIVEEVDSGTHGARD
jgi:hypothetical protein